MNNQPGSAYSMYSAPPMADNRMYPMQHASAEQYQSGGMHQNAAAAMSGWPGQIPPQGNLLFIIHLFVVNYLSFFLDLIVILNVFH